MKFLLSTSITVFTLFAAFSTRASSSPAPHDGSGIAREANVRMMIKRQGSSSSSSISTSSNQTASSVPSASQTSSVSISSGSASAQASGAHGYGYGITSNNGTGSSQADGLGFEICLLKEGICLGDAAAFAIGTAGKGDGYAGGVNSDGTKGSVAHAGVDGLGIAAADAANLCIKDACFGLAGAIAYGKSASAGATGGDLTTATPVATPTVTGQTKPAKSFSTITAASDIPTGLLPALLGGVGQLIEIKSLHLRAEPTPVV